MFQFYEIKTYEVNLSGLTDGPLNKEHKAFYGEINCLRNLKTEFKIYWTSLTYLNHRSERTDGRRDYCKEQYYLISIFYALKI